uniref:BBS2_C domain-containing protein n=1 Tax=Anisakis simplex TaxID=6269 RepID=A0A0M3KEJ5_ANISI
LHVKAFIGYPESTHLHVFELTRALPRFSMFALCNDTAPAPEGNAVFTINERPPRLASWINENFLLCDEVGCEEDCTLSVRFYSMRSAGMLFIEMDNSGKVTVRNDDMELVGNVIQAIAEYFHITNITTIASFPKAMKAFSELTEKLNEMFALRDQLAAAVAERANSVKEMLVRAEDARIIGQIQMMRKYYVKLQTLNQALVTDQMVRCNNHEQLLKTLRELNKTIEKGARLRVGDPASKVIAACRSAIAEENFDMLPKIILFGV